MLLKVIRLSLNLNGSKGKEELPSRAARESKAAHDEVKQPGFKTGSD